MTNQRDYEIIKNPPVSYRMYWPEAVLLLASFITPFVAWLIWHSPVMFARSGSLVVFFALLTEFISLHRMNKKHITNACRIKAGETPWDFSRPANVVGVLALVLALAGTLVWGYGDLWFVI